jgi:hypothetical protein
MGLHPIYAFQNKASRPRAIIWTGTALTALVLFIAVMVGTTTSYWFCAELCHKVQDDSITSYLRSTHSKVSCVSCHMPPGADPVTFLLHKVEALGELPPTLDNSFEVPLNPLSEVALDESKFPDIACTQCHDMSTREVTATHGMKTNHNAHTKAGVRCTICHNRTAHNESGEWEPRTVTPSTGERAWKHPNYMSMYGCFRCHSQSLQVAVSGECSDCHTTQHDLRPTDHKTDNFRFAHGQFAVEEDLRYERVLEYFAGEGFNAEWTAARKNHDIERLRENYVAEQRGEKPASGGHGAAFEWPVMPVEAVHRCYMCHNKTRYCDACHVEKGVSY